MLGKVSMRSESESTFLLHNLVACVAVFVILQTILQIVAFWSLKAGLSNSAKDKTSRESLLISLQPRAAGVATGIFT